MYKLMGSAIIAATLGTYAWMFTPAYIIRPNQPAPPGMIEDAKTVFDEQKIHKLPDGTEYTTGYTGECSDLSDQTRAALSDGVLTNREAHDLRKAAVQLYNTAQTNSALNQALEASGRPGNNPVPNCSHGGELFKGA